MEAVQTFASDTPGKEAGLIAADPRQISFTVHHSLIRLPAPGFQVRKFDIRSGSHATLVYDFGTPLGQDVALQLANHFRLDKVDPMRPVAGEESRSSSTSTPPRPNPAHGAATGRRMVERCLQRGRLYRRVSGENPAPDVDPQDARYSIVNWDDRLTRSWSYGGGSSIRARARSSRAMSCWARCACGRTCRSSRDWSARRPTTPAGRTIRCACR
jgi:hypothetical protein